YPKLDVNYVGAYDCVKVMLLGMHQFLEKNPQYSPEMLSNGSLNRFFTPDKFANTAFGATDLAGTAFVDLPTKPVFYGGFNTPPPDGPQSIELILSWQSGYGITLASLATFGMAYCIAMFISLVYFRDSKIIKSMSPLFTAIYICGTLVANASLLTFIGPVTTTSCSLRVWVPFMAIPLTLGMSAVKNLRVFAVFYLSRQLKILVTWTRSITSNKAVFLCQFLVVTAAVTLLVLWSVSFDPQGYYTMVDGSFKAHICLVSSGNGADASDTIIAMMIVYVTFLLTANGCLGYGTSTVFGSLSESSFLSISTIFGVIAFGVTLAATYSYEPSLETIFVSNLVTWCVANLNLTVLFVPKLMEIWMEGRDDGGSLNGSMVGSLPTTSLFSERRLSAASDAKLLRPIRPVIKSSSFFSMVSSWGRSVDHINLRAVNLKYRTILFWSKWVRSGVTLFQNNERRWIVFEFDENCVAWPVDDLVNIENQTNKIVLMQVYTDTGNMTAVMEFDDVDRAKTFVDTFNNFFKESTPCDKQIRNEISRFIPKVYMGPSAGHNRDENED
ncbi:hypothetical protein HDU76_009089, partial [Blyttiomyces sp. JEL0837]